MSCVLLETMAIVRVALSSPAHTATYGSYKYKYNMYKYNCAAEYLCCYDCHSQ